jgi:hypothetical protein
MEKEKEDRIMYPEYKESSYNTKLIKMSHKDGGFVQFKADVPYGYGKLLCEQFPSGSKVKIGRPGLLMKQYKKVGDRVTSRM